MGVSIGPTNSADYYFYYRYETIAWIPSAITFIVMLGVGGKHLGSNIPPDPPASAATIVSFGTTIASSVISWCIMTSDYGVYHTGKASRFVCCHACGGLILTSLLSMRVFLYSYAGFLTASVSHP